jgi:hypothetical protein
MKRIMLAAAVLGLFLADGRVTKAEPFVNPPESAWSPPWVGGAPYQRNIFWDFSVNPVGGPSSGGTPGADYEGFLDQDLRTSDFVTFTGAVQWFQTVTVGGNTYNGAIGIVNNDPNGQALTGVVTFHIDNLVDDLSLKNIWIEDTGVKSAGSTLTETIVAPPGFVSAGPFNQSSTPIDNGLFRENVGFQVIPNPEFEEDVLTFVVPAGGFIIFDSYHIATQSVPEPSSLILLGTGGAVALFARRRRQRALKAEKVS